MNCTNGFYTYIYIYKKYTYIALYLGTGTVSFLSRFKDDVSLPLSVVQPSSSQLAKLCLQWFMAGVW